MRAVMLAFILACLIVAAIIVGIAHSHSTLCPTGSAKGFAFVTGDPRLGGIGVLPSTFTSNGQFFGTRYNCTKRSVYARRLDEGVYEVMFPGNRARIAVVSAATDQSAVASVTRNHNTFRVTIRGPYVKNEILVPREISFYIVIF